MSKDKERDEERIKITKVKDFTEYLDLVREAAGLKNSDKSKGCIGVGKFGYIL